MTQEYVNDIADFISRYVTHMLGAGVHTSRVVRNSKRIGEALGTEVRIHTSQKTATLTVCEKGGSTMSTRVLDIPGFPISFEWNADLSALSWAAYDNDMSLEAIQHKFDELISKPKINPWFVLFMVGLANASFNHYIVFIFSAFVASLCASSALSLGIESAEIALATSVLYLVPGVPLINGVIDITDGHIQIGISRLVNALMLIVCIAIGMSGTLMLVKDSLL